MTHQHIVSFFALVLCLGCGDDESSVTSNAVGGTGQGGAATGATGSGAVGTGGNSSTGGASAGGQSQGGGGGTASVCPAAADQLPFGEHQKTIDFDGNERSYEIQVPLSYDPSQPAPLVLDIHGFTSDKDQQQLISGMEAKAEDEGFIVVRPNGFGFAKSWNAGDVCCGEAVQGDLDDVGLMKAIVAEVSQELCIDDRRVYATGISNGGALSHRLACEADDVFAAVAPVSYPIDFDPFTACQPSRPISVMHHHGTSDLLVPYNGSLTMPSTPESFEYWALTNGCSGSPVVTYSKGTSECETYQSCNAGVETTLCTINGGHILYTNLDQVPLADLSWAFLSKFTLP